MKGRENDDICLPNALLSAFWVVNFYDLYSSPLTAVAAAAAAKMRYISWAETEEQLKAPHYTQPTTSTTLKFQHFQGRHHAEVYTIRFNQIPSFSENFMINCLLNNLSERYEIGDILTVSILHDVLIENSKDDPPTYYIWTANTNQHTFNQNNAIMMSFTHANVYRYCQAVERQYTPEFNLMFTQSGCSIFRMLALVYTFVRA